MCLKKKKNYLTGEAIYLSVFRTFLTCQPDMFLAGILILPQQAHVTISFLPAFVSGLSFSWEGIVFFIV